MSNDNEVPSVDGLSYEEVQSWSTLDLEANLQQPKSRALFAEFLESSLAGENIKFIEAVRDFEVTKATSDRKTKAKAIFKRFPSKLNIEPELQAELKTAASSSSPPVESYSRTKDHVMRLLNADLFPRYLKSDIYLGFLEQFLPPSELAKWSKSFEALLGNTVGRWRFKKFLRKIHADENLRFVDCVRDYKKLDDPAYRAQRCHQIYQQFLADDAPTQVHIHDKIRKGIRAKIVPNSESSEDEVLKEADRDLFDEPMKVAMDHMKNDPYFRFLQSEEFTSLVKIVEERNNSK